MSETFQKYLLDELIRRNQSVEMLNKETIKKAVLFDIDGTILNCNLAAGISLMKAAQDVFGETQKPKKIDIHGKTDPLILVEMLSAMGIDSDTIQREKDTLKQKYFYYLEKNISRHETYLMPGVEKVIKELSADSTVLLGLLTGNFTESAHIKLSGFNLNNFFAFGAFGDDSGLRNDLPPVARKKIKDKYSINIDFDRIIIIGDTIYDIECAKKSGAVSIAVGTGWGEKDKLLGMKPDFYFDSMEDSDLILRTIESI